LHKKAANRIYFWLGVAWSDSRASHALGRRTRPAFNALLTASIQTSYYSMWHYNYTLPIKGLNVAVEYHDAETQIHYRLWQHWRKT